MGLIRTELMPDSSEVVPYDHAGFPLYIRAAHLASYYNMCAPCHWHDAVSYTHLSLKNTPIVARIIPHPYDIIRISISAIGA